MIYSDLIPQTRIWKLLLASWHNRKFSHALLFYGPHGTGKEAYALEVAALVNCDQPDENGACGVCPGCSKVSSFQHGNVELILPLPRSRKELSPEDSPLKGLSSKEIQALRSKMESMSQNPYYKIEMENANTILIHSIRDLRRRIYMSHADRGWKAILIFDAEKLCIPQPEAANALLKILEEPPPNTVFVLVTSRIDQILDTIKSRCLPFYFPPLKQSEITEYLIRQGKDADQSRTAAHISGGDIRMALRIVQDQKKMFTDVELFARTVFRSDPKDWQKLIRDIGTRKKSGIYELGNIFRIAGFFFRDLMVAERNAAEDHLVFRDFAPRYEKLLVRFPDACWSECLEVVENTQRAIQANGYVPLMTVTMLLDLRKAIHGEIRDTAPETLLSP